MDNFCNPHTPQHPPLHCSQHSATPPTYPPYLYTYLSPNATPSPIYQMLTTPNAPSLHQQGGWSAAPLTPTPNHAVGGSTSQKHHLETGTTQSHQKRVQVAQDENTPPLALHSVVQPKSNKVTSGSGPAQSTTTSAIQPFHQPFTNFNSVTKTLKNSKSMSQLASDVWYCVAGVNSKNYSGDLSEIPQTKEWPQKTAFLMCHFCL